MDLLAANPAVTRKSAGTQVGRVAAIHNPAPQPRKSQPLMETGFDQEQYIAETEDMRLKHLEEQAMYALKISCENFENAQNRLHDQWPHSVARFREGMD